MQPKPTPPRRFAPAAMTAVVAAGLVTSGAMSAADGGDADLPLACEIAVQESASGTTIEGRVHASRAVEGRYTMAISRSGSGGSAQVNQSGRFDAGPEAPATLGRTRLGGEAGLYDVELVLEWNGHRIICRESDGTIEL